MPACGDDVGALGSVVWDATGGDVVDGEVVDGDVAGGDVSGGAADDVVGAVVDTLGASQLRHNGIVRPANTTRAIATVHLPPGSAAMEKAACVGALLNSGCALA